MEPFQRAPVEHKIAADQELSEQNIRRFATVRIGKAVGAQCQETIEHAAVAVQFGKFVRFGVSVFGVDLNDMEPVVFF